MKPSDTIRYNLYLGIDIRCFENTAQIELVIHDDL